MRLDDIANERFWVETVYAFRFSKYEGLVFSEARDQARAVVSQLTEEEIQIEYAQVVLEDEFKIRFIGDIDQ